MTVFSAIYTIVFALLIGAIMLLMPALVAKTLPLGVSVPAERADEPVIAAAIRRYRALVVVAALTTVVVGLLLAIVAPVAAMIVSPLLILALTAAAYLTARARIVEAKREGEWYRGVRTRVSADVAPPRRLAPPIGWLLACVALLVVIAAVGVALYPSIPAVLPMHWNAAGQVDRTAAKSVWTVFQLPLIAALLAVGFYGLSWLIRWMPVRARASEAADGARRRADATLRYTTMALGVIALVIVVGFGAMSILTDRKSVV